MSIRHKSQVIGLSILGLIFSSSLSAQVPEDNSSLYTGSEGVQDAFPVITLDYEKSLEFGVAGGTAFATVEPGKLAAVKIVHNGKQITAIQCDWKEDGVEHIGKIIGGPGTAEDIIRLKQNENIVRIEGRYGASISQLVFFTSEGRKFGPFGDKTNAGKPFEIRPRRPIVGFFGHSGNFINAIGTLSTRAYDDN